GQLSNRHRSLCAVTAFVVIMIVTGIIGSNITTELFFDGSMTTALAAYNQIYGLLWVTLAETAALAAAFFFATTFLLRRKLNLE
ncbi:MAG: hypothetical protein PHS97_07770, partial [Oscillospiraceae bacterium]|nr:hypothetical protein [Oscillospiraceae bacterium]